MPVMSFGYARFMSMSSAAILSSHGSVSIGFLVAVGLRCGVYDASFVSSMRSASITILCAWLKTFESVPIWLSEHRRSASASWITWPKSLEQHMLCTPKPLSAHLCCHSFVAWPAAAITQPITAHPLTLWIPLGNPDRSLTPALPSSLESYCTALTTVL